MKRTLIFVIILLVFPLLYGFCGDPSLSTGLGMDFFFSRDAEVFLTTSAAFNIPAGKDMEVAVGAEFALWPRKGDDPAVIEPAFFIPVNLGVQFVFSEPVPNFLLGMGITPTFIIVPDADPLLGEEVLRFYAGPYLKGGIRLQIHEVMSWFVELQQDLAIGKPNWINTTTRLLTGINFKLANEAAAKKPPTSAKAALLK